MIAEIKSSVVRFFTNKHCVPAILIAGICLRILWAIFVQPEPVSDAAVYYGRAKQLANGMGYVYPNGEPTAYWPVGYSAFLSFFIKLLGSSGLAIIISNIFLQISILAAFYYFAKIFSNSELTARIGLFILSFYPDQIAYSSLTTSELLGSFLTLIYFILAIKYRSHTFMIILSGMILGLTSLTKAQSLLLPVVVFIYFIWIYLDKKNITISLKQIMLTLMTAILVISPWACRNYKAFGGFVPVSTNGGVNLYIGNNPDATGRYIWTERMQSQFEDMNEYERNIKAGRLASEYIKSEPLKFIAMMPRKLFYLLKTDGDGLSWNQEGLKKITKTNDKLWWSLKVIATVYYYPILVIGLIYTFYHTIKFLKRDGNLLALASLVVLYYLLIYGVFYGAPRYHDIFIPFLILLTGDLVRKWLANSK